MYTFCEELEVTLNKFYKFRIPSTITSRYMPPDVKKNEDN